MFESKCFAFGHCYVCFGSMRRSKLILLHVLTLSQYLWAQEDLTAISPQDCSLECVLQVILHTHDLSLCPLPDFLYLSQNIWLIFTAIVGTLNGRNQTGLLGKGGYLVSCTKECIKLKCVFRTSDSARGGGGLS